MNPEYSTMIIGLVENLRLGGPNVAHMDPQRFRDGFDFYIAAHSMAFYSICVIYPSTVFSVTHIISQA